VISLRRTEDVDLVAELDRACFPVDVPMVQEKIDHAWWWVARLGGEPVAYAGLLAQDGGAKAFLCRAGVLPQARGGGLQRRLLRAREAHARRVGVPRLYTYTSVFNFASTNSLLAAGYRPYFADVAEGNAFVYYQKMLDGSKPPRYRG
jgi:GNAT superfamily N-acetyltransferase